MKFKGRLYNDGGGRLKIVTNDLPLGRYNVTITKVDGRPTDLAFATTITSNGPKTCKFKVPPFPGLRPGAVVEGFIEDELRCRWCGAKCSALINNLCDHCFEYFNSPYKPLCQKGWGRLT